MKRERFFNDATPRSYRASYSGRFVGSGDATGRIRCSGRCNPASHRAWVVRASKDVQVMSDEAFREAYEAIGEYENVRERSGSG